MISIRVNNCLATTVLVAIMLLFSYQSALASESSTKQSETEKMISEATVNLFCTLKSGRTVATASGSGAIIDERGVILTNAHVAIFFLLAEGSIDKLSGNCVVRTGSPADSSYIAKILYIPTTWLDNNLESLADGETKSNGEHDFALLYITDALSGELPDSFPTISRNGELLAEGSQVFMAGYPTEKLSSSQLRNKLVQVVATSTITNIQKFGADGFYDRITMESAEMAQLGASGGPVTDSKGNALGVITTKSVREDDHKLKAVTFSYIDREIKSAINFSLEALLASELSVRAFITKYVIPKDSLEEFAVAVFDR